MADARTDYIIATLGKLFFGQATEKEIKAQVGDKKDNDLKKEITAFLDGARYVCMLTLVSHLVSHSLLCSPAVQCNCAPLSHNSFM